MRKGLLLYFIGLGVSIVKPPVERLACMDLSTGKVMMGINYPLLLLELGLIFIGSYLMASTHKFKNAHAMSSFMSLASGVGAALIGLSANSLVISLFGIVLAALGLILYKFSRWFS
ncbi:hypothetical protein PNA2_0117 [Pyrococcus sp. NA2]|nr:hypothetical protein PNA2_0117 [Pyrococcus sp. NA2]